jgi:hypothetical protein
MPNTAAFQTKCHYPIYQQWPRLLALMNRPEWMDNHITGASHSVSTHRAIVVDLDGTLVNTDMLVENLFLFLRLHPLRILEVILWLF